MTVCSVTEARERLLDNARLVSIEHRGEILEWNPVRADGRHFLPAYVPYIGRDYFGTRTRGCRILAYALSQNLSDTSPPARRWAEDWRDDDRLLALDRQNHAYQESGMAEMFPFDTGHIPILASLLRSLVQKRVPGDHESIYPSIAATNLSKFSFRSHDKRHTIDDLQSLRNCWAWLSRLEVIALQPDYIICCDGRVFDIVAHGVRELADSIVIRPRVLRVSFPSLRVINRHYRKALRSGHLSVEQLLERIASLDIDRPVAHGTIGKILRRDSYYFAEIHKRFEVHYLLSSSPRKED